MRKEEDNTLGLIMVAVIILFILFLFVFLLPRLSIAINIDENIYCEDRFFGVDDSTKKMLFEENKLGKFCVLYDLETFDPIKKIPFNYTEAYEYCEVPGLFDITKWSNRCN